MTDQQNETPATGDGYTHRVHVFAVIRIPINVSLTGEPTPCELIDYATDSGAVDDLMRSIEQSLSTYGVESAEEISHYLIDPLGPDGELDMSRESIWVRDKHHWRLAGDLLEKHDQWYPEPPDATPTVAPDMRQAARMTREALLPTLQTMPPPELGGPNWPLLADSLQTYIATADAMRSSLEAIANDCDRYIGEDEEGGEIPEDDRIESPDVLVTAIRDCAREAIRGTPESPPSVLEALIGAAEVALTYFEDTKHGREWTESGGVEAQELREALAAARTQPALPDLLQTCRELRDHLVHHATFGLNAQEVDMLRRADAVLARHSLEPTGSHDDHDHAQS